ncbi:MAG: methionyl-tRNA formyltransferase [Rhodospirillaceae bacterium]|jgi:methionyl-tRNA formyltransferase
MRVIFMGSPDFSVPILSGLIDAGHDIVCVYAQPPRPAGRGHKETPCPVHAVALEKNLTVRTPKSLKDSAEQKEFAELKADIAVVAAYGLILPKEILEAPRLGCVNVHASLLPRWRGAAPIHRAILASDSETGVTIMQMDEGLDTGAMLMAERVAITPETTAEMLHDQLAEMGATMITGALRELEAGNATPVPQPEDGVTYAKKLERGEGRLDWRKPALELERAVRAFHPWPGTWFELPGADKNARVKVLAAHVADGTGQKPGTVIDDKLTVACGEGALRLDRLQREGKGAMSADEFLRGNALAAGTVIE